MAPLLASRALKALLKTLRLMDGGAYEAVYHSMQSYHHEPEVQANGLAVLWAAGHKNRATRGTSWAPVPS